ncbi:hypothetical protein [Kribbella shirazensis]|uniref:Uncharacterized protein n=1 Tax=Kribbella shirazensis TaxID=1105143 RepID=A0A7X5VB97_9ACTN|nr:hypothetical protein [Kribbella shirazensis]NIK58045.1 hypothetical protein [Kribbella shirazensis]
MRREEVQPLLVQATDRLPEPDLADAAWAAGLTVRRRRRRTVLISLLAVLVLAIIASILIEAGAGGRADLNPPDREPTRPPGYIQPAGQIAGLDFWVAPPPGSERFLDRLDTPLGDRLELPDSVRSLTENRLEGIAAVVLVKESDRYVPLLLGSDATWARADVGLVAVGGAAPLSSGAVAPDGRSVAFPQPGALITVNAPTAEISRHDLPSGEYRSVSWIGDGERLLVSGPGVAYQVLVGEGGPEEQTVVPVAPARDPEEVTAPFRIQTGSVMRYLFNGRWTEDSRLTLPVRSWVGQTFSSISGTARLFVANDLEPVPTRGSQAQVVAAISTLRMLPSRLLVLGEPQGNPPRNQEGAGDRPFFREPGCCAVLGWYDDGNVLLQVHGWILAWNLESGRVLRVTELAVDQVALGPGLRY